MSTGNEASGGGVLGVLGPGPAEEAAYELLVDRSSAALADLAAGWTRPEPLDRVLAVLEDSGLASQIPGEPMQHTVTPPDVALEALLLARERQVREAREHLRRLSATYQRHTAGPRPAVVERLWGRAAAAQRLDQLVRAARNEVRVMVRPSFLGDPCRSVAQPAADLAVRVLYEHGTVGPAPAGEGAAGATVTARVAPALPLVCILVDRRLALVALDPSAGDAAVVVYPSGLLTALGLLFEGLWERALPLELVRVAAASPGDGDPHRMGDADLRRLVELLLSGVTHAAAARQLNVSYRTVERRIAAMMSEFGGRTMFQAGVRAALHGYRLPDA